MGIPLEACQPFLNQSLDRFTVLSALFPEGSMEAIHVYSDAAERSGNNKPVPAVQLEAGLSFGPDATHGGTSQLNKKGCTSLGTITGSARAVHGNGDVIPGVQELQKFTRSHCSPAAAAAAHGLHSSSL